MYFIEFNEAGLEPFQAQMIRATLALNSVTWLLMVRPEGEQRIPRVVFEKTAMVMNAHFPDRDFRVEDGGE